MTREVVASAGSGNENEGLISSNRMCITNANKKAGSLTPAVAKWKLYDNPYYAAKSVAKSDGEPCDRSILSAPANSRERAPCKQIDRQSLLQKRSSQRTVRISPPPILPFPPRSHACQTPPVTGSELPKSNFPQSSKEPRQSIDGNHTKFHGQRGEGSFCVSANTQEVLKVVTKSTKSSKQPDSNEPNVASLKTDLEVSLVHLNTLEQSMLLAQAEVDSLTKQLDVKKEVWHCRIQTKVAASIQALKGEAKEEINSNKTMQFIQNKLENEISKVKKASAKIRHELERQNESRRLLKDVADELGKEIEDGKPWLKAARREIAKARHESEKERKMLQMGELWREEKVHTRLTQARYEVEEQAMAMDELKYQIETFLITKSAIIMRHSDLKNQESSSLIQHKLKHASQASNRSSHYVTLANTLPNSGSPKVGLGDQSLKQRRWNR